ncbi:MAG TPA: hypothetical protein VGQ99_21000 [Tepidisphaeraceae bacterium]|jgi:HTH-type transcriptional regulator/antitoxin HigA|nr:hypothetical protein [Tepidisphaeraceae bacterium]
MRLQPIKSERDYRNAMKLIDALIDARPSTPDGDRLEILVALVDAWEEKHHPIDPPAKDSRWGRL